MILLRRPTELSRRRRRIHQISSVLIGNSISTPRLRKVELMKTEWKFSLPCLLVLLYFLIPLRSLASNHRLALLLIGGNVLLIFLTVFLPILAARLHAKHGGESPVGVAFIVVGIGAVALTLLFSFSGATFVLNDVVILFICLLFAVGIVGAYVVKRAAQRARDAAASVACLLYTSPSPRDA